MVQPSTSQTKPSTQSTTDKKRPSKVTVMTEPDKPYKKPTKKEREDTEYFQTNAVLVSGLLPMLSANDRSSVRKWMKKFFLTGGTDEERIIRNDYLWFLLIQLESGSLTLPFTKEPKPGALKPLAKAINRKLYEEILQAANNRAAHLDDLTPGERVAKEAENTQHCRPSEFLPKQPKPVMGFIAYGSCFSDQLS